MNDKAAIILAAGISSRMKTNVPKVMHNVCGRPMLAFVLDACREAGIEKILVVVGFGAGNIREAFANTYDITWVVQKQQKGTAHAVLCCREQLMNFEGDTFILCGDGPLIRPETLTSLMEKHRIEQSALTLATAVLDNPDGYGRIVRNGDGNIHQIVEHKDCTAEQLAIKEVNPSYYLFNNKILFESLQNVKPDNVQKEYYLTDAVSVILASGLKVSAVTAVRPEEAMSANNQEQLDKINEVMRRRLKDSN